MFELNNLDNFKQIRLTQGVIPYREYGVGETIVFVHGFLVNGYLWRKVVPTLTKNFRCIVPEWPLGSHKVAMNSDADLSPQGLAELIAEFLIALELEEVTLIGNDTGGALCQLVITEHPEYIARLILTNCDAFDNFLPLMFRYLQWGAHIPGFIHLTAQLMQLPVVRRLPNAFGWLTKRPIEREISDCYVAPIASNSAIQRDVSKLLKGISSKYTIAAAGKFANFKKPVLLAWAPEDPFFRFQDAQKMFKCFPNAQLECIYDSYAFVPEDQPQRLVELIAAFMHKPM